MSKVLSRLNLKHFELIAAIAECGQLSIAAAKLAMTQPAASRALAEIERQLAAALFERHPKGMRATPVGTIVIRHALRILGDVEHAADEFDAFAAGRSGTVRVGAVTGAAVGYLVPAIHALKRETEGTLVSIQVAPSVNLMESLLSGDLDFALCRIPPGVDASRLDIVLGRSEFLRFVVRSGHPLLGRRGLPIGALGDLTWVVQAQGMPIREAIDQEYIRAGGDPPSDVIETSSLVLTLAYLQGSDALAPVAEEVARLLDTSGIGGFTALDVSGEFKISPYHLLTLKSNALSPMALRLLDLVHRQISA